MEEIVSIIIPVYKVEKYMNRCIESIMNQTYKKIEIILVDDGSPDNCGKLCDEYAKKDKRVVVVHKENGGLSDARNAGIDIAKGKYIAFVDSDDYVDNDYVEILYKAISEDKSDIAISSHKVMYENGTILEKATGERNILTQKETIKRILYDEGIDLSAWAKLYKKELFKTMKFPKGRLFEDAAITCKIISLTEKVSLVSKSTYNYIIRNDSITTKDFTPSKMDLITSTKEMSEYVKEKYPDLEDATNRRVMYAYLSTLSQLAMSNKRFPEEQKILMKYIKENGNKILKDKKVPKRDKLGILATKFGFAFFRIFWNLYRRKTGRVA